MSCALAAAAEQKVANDSESIDRSGNTLVAKGWTTQAQQSGGIDGARGMRGVQAVFSDRKTAVRIATATRSVNCFADLGYNEEEFFLKSYHTSSMYNLMYEDASAQSFTMLRHWTESGDEFNKYIQEFNYDAFDPTGLALGNHFGIQHLLGYYSFTTDLNESCTTRSHEDIFGVRTQIGNWAELELKGPGDHRPISVFLSVGIIEGMHFFANDIQTAGGYDGAPFFWDSSSWKLADFNLDMYLIFIIFLSSVTPPAEDPATYDLAGQDAANELEKQYNEKGYEFTDPDDHNKTREEYKTERATEFANQLKQQANDINAMYIDDDIKNLGFMKEMVAELSASAALAQGAFGKAGYSGRIVTKVFCVGWPGSQVRSSLPADSDLCESTSNAETFIASVSQDQIIGVYIHGHNVAGMGIQYGKKPSISVGVDVVEDPVTGDSQLYENTLSSLHGHESCKRLGGKLEGKMDDGAALVVDTCNNKEILDNMRAGGLNTDSLSIVESDKLSMRGYDDSNKDGDFDSGENVWIVPYRPPDLPKKGSVKQTKPANPSPRPKGIPIDPWDWIWKDVLL